MPHSAKQQSFARVTCTTSHAPHPQLTHAYCEPTQEEGSQQQEDPAAREREVRQEVTRRIKQLGQQRKFKEAVQELASLATLGIQPDTQAATALLAACTRSRDMKMAQGVFDQLFGAFVLCAVVWCGSSGRIAERPAIGVCITCLKPEWFTFSPSCCAVLRAMHMQPTSCSRMRSRLQCCCAAMAAKTHQPGRA